LGNSLKNLSRKVKVYLHITKASGIARRYFVMNGFDGAMTIFGIVLGSWIAKVTKPEIILLAGFGACLAMGVALIDGLSPALTATISLTPFILASMKIISISNAYFASLALSMVTLFLLGIYLGKIAKENGWLYGVAMIVVGAITALTIFIIQLFLGR